MKKFPSNDINKIYHDNVYGFPISDDNELFERLILEINQAGLSWSTILKKQKNFQKAYDDFVIKKVATYDETKKQKLLNDSGIVRNRLKIEATIYNAKVILELQNEFGSFQNWLSSHHPMIKSEWVKLFKKTFKFTGKEIVGEFLMSIGYLEGAHTKECCIYHRIIASKPKWLENKKEG
ncbi:MAG: DNA-3-methyladenine glycosylase I [Epsilonproteobacteria bacterium]|nr:DNA-3-methyladenine glycosylase I [Campylobacterota bacterium]